MILKIRTWLFHKAVYWYMKERESYRKKYFEVHGRYPEGDIY
ncbi:hypothetical protein ABEX78_32255 [Priestia megaterium]